MNKRGLLLAVAVIAIATTLVLLAEPSLAAHLAVHTVLLGLLGALMILLGLARIQRANGMETDLAETDNPDDVIPVDPPGGDIDQQLDSFDRPKKEWEVTIQGLEDRIEHVLIELISRQRSCSTAEAQEIVARGEWTDDVLAASYLGSSGSVSGQGSWRDRLREEIDPDGLRRDRLAATIEEIADQAGLDADGGDST